jgi:alpha-L-arabinofuranosidase
MLTARLAIDPSSTIGTINRRLFGSFVEHLGRCVYDGIYEPGHPSADADGFRTDVLDLVRELGPTTIRYPGGNFVSGFRWEDAVGPRADRPKRLDLAWHSLEPNEVGIDEFARWSAKAEVEMMYAVNLGTRGIQEALDVLEYANVRSGSELSDARIANGTVEPHAIKMWCLGNEMDGPWQLGHWSAEDYGQRATQTARAMRQLDSTLELVVCGSSNAHMPTFGAWERTVLEAAYDDVDYISCHAYYSPKGGDVDSFLASGLDMDHFIEVVASTADAVKAEKGSEKEMKISFDEWNVWDIERFEKEDKITDIEVWPVAPRLLEDSYSVIDAVVVGGLLISLLRHSDRVTSASLAQLVNVIAPIMTEPGGPAWRQTTFFPFAISSRLARGSSLALQVESPTYPTAVFGDVAIVDAVATHDDVTGSSAIFLVNRSQTDSVSVEIDITAVGDVQIVENHLLTNDDHLAANTLAQQDRVGIVVNETASISDGKLVVTLPPVSWSAFALGAGSV